MGKRIIGARTTQRGIVVMAAATALVAFGSAGIASADKRDSGGQPDPVRDAISSVTDTATSVIDNITSALTPRPTTHARSGRGSDPSALVKPDTTVANRPVIIRRPDTKRARTTAALTPTLPRDGINFGTGGTCTGEPCGTNTGPGINIFRFGNNNSNVANNTVDDGGVFGSNLAFVGNNSLGSGNNTVLGVGSTGSNLAIGILGGADTDNAGFNRVIGGGSSGINLAILSIGNDDSGRNIVEGTNSSGANLAVIGPFTTNSGNNLVTDDGSSGINLAGVGGFSENSGNNTGGGMNLAYVDPFSQSSGNNTGGGINIAIVPPFATNVGNCSASLCINLLGVQLLGG
jgi:hypothetical protein